MPPWIMSGCVTPPEAPLDPDLAALLADPRLALSRPPDGVSMEAFRKAANGYLKRAPRPDVALVEDIVIAGAGGPLALRRYRPTTRLGDEMILFLHGGGFVFGDLETHDAMCRGLALASGVSVVAVDYRLAPEHPYPAALNDAVAALEWVRAEHHPARIAVAGDSAGAQLSVATAMVAARCGEPVDALALLYPCVDPDRAGPSHATFGQGHMLTSDFLDWVWAAYRGGDETDDPLFDLRLADLSGLPPTAMMTAGYDPLRDEGLLLGQRMEQAGVVVTSQHYPDMIHGFVGLPYGSHRTAEAITWLGTELRARLSPA